MSKRHNPKYDTSVFDDRDDDDFEVEGLTYDISLDDLLDDLEPDDEETPWTGRSPRQERARLSQLRDLPVTQEDSGDPWDGEW